MFLLLLLLLLLLLCQTHGHYGWVDPHGSSYNSKLKATVETARQQEVHKKVGYPSFRLGRGRHVGRQLREQAVYVLVDSEWWKTQTLAEPDWLK